MTEKNRQIIDTIGSAAVWKDSSPVTPIADRLGLNSQTMLTKRKRVNEFKSTNDCFEPMRRKVRKDCVAPAATACVWNWCHSQDASRVDTESNQLYSVQDPTTGVKVKHPKRVWNDASHQKSFEVFLRSDDYAAFQKNNPGRGIGISRFRTSVCSCCTRESSEDAIGSEH